MRLVVPDLLGLGDRRAQTKSDVVCEMRSAKRKDCRVLHRATLVNDQAGCFRADVDECGAKLFIVIS